MPGQRIDRYGELTGKYFSPIGTPLPMRALPYNTKLTEYHAFEVVKPFEVQKSTIAPNYGQIGFGTQYLSFESAKMLLDKGIITLIDP